MPAPELCRYQRPRVSGPAPLQILDIGEGGRGGEPALAGEKAGASQEERLNERRPAVLVERLLEAFIGMEARQVGEGFLIAAVAERPQQAFVEDLVRSVAAQGERKARLLLAKAHLPQPSERLVHLRPAQTWHGLAAGLLPERGLHEPEAELAGAPGDPRGQRYDGRPPPAGEQRILAGVVLEDDVEDQVVVAAIAVMAVSAEGARPDVQFDVAPKQPAAVIGDDGSMKSGPEPPPRRPR